MHIEIVHSLNTSSFSQALRLFVARRGPLVEIKSDNEANLVSSERELREAIQNWNSKQTYNFLLRKGIDRSFNPPGASHHGGLWERQIRSVREQLNAICQEQLLTDESLITLMCEVEAIIDTRPLKQFLITPMIWSHLHLTIFY